MNGIGGHTAPIAGPASAGHRATLSAMDSPTNPTIILLIIRCGFGYDPTRCIAWGDQCDCPEHTNGCHMMILMVVAVAGLMVGIHVDCIGRELWGEGWRVFRK